MRAGVWVGGWIGGCMYTRTRTRRTHTHTRTRAGAEETWEIRKKFVDTLRSLLWKSKILTYDLAGVGAKPMGWDKAEFHGVSYMGIAVFDKLHRRLDIKAYPREV